MATEELKFVPDSYMTMHVRIHSLVKGPFTIFRAYKQYSFCEPPPSYHKTYPENIDVMLSA